MREKNPNQILRIDGKNVFFEVMRNAFNIDKVQINFIEYDPQNKNQQTKKIPLFIGIDKFLVLSNDIISGRISALANKEKAETEKRKQEAEKQGKDTKYIYANAIFTDMGGIPLERLKKQQEKWKKENPDKPMFNFEIPEGKCLSRQFKITPGASQPWIISGEQGIGDDNNETGLIVPVASGSDRVYKPKEIVRVPLVSDEELKRFALFVTAHINAYLSAKYVDWLSKPQE